MDINDFETLGECPFGTIWRVASEDKVVINAYQAALYFSTLDFFHFAKMVESAAQNLVNVLQTPPFQGEPVLQNSPPIASIEKSKVQEIEAFRKKRQKKNGGKNNGSK